MAQERGVDRVIISRSAIFGLFVFALMSCAPTEPSFQIPASFRRMTSHEIANKLTGRTFHSIYQGKPVSETQVKINLSGVISIGTGLGLVVSKRYSINNNLLCIYEGRFSIFANGCYIFVINRKGHMMWADFPVISKPRVVRVIFRNLEFAN
jgi:hypothetical protein